jgi:hypothetical protein
MSFRGTVFVPDVEKFCQLFEEAKRYAQKHTGRGQLVCFKNREEDGKIKWISGKLVLRMRSGSNWRAVVLSGTVLYCTVPYSTVLYCLVGLPGRPAV